MHFSGDISRFESMASRVMPWRLVCGVILVGCVPPEADLLSMPLDDGRALSELVTSADTTALLLYAPGDCLTCGSPVHEWSEWAVRGTGRASRIVLSGSPTRTELRSLLAARVPIAGVLRSGTALPDTPRIYLIANGILVDSAIGRQSASAFTARVALGP